MATSAIGKPVIDPKFWDRKAWPKADSGKACIFEAIEIVGSALHGDEWTGEEVRAVEPPDCDGPCYERLIATVERLAQLSRDGIVATYGRRQSGGDLYALDASTWNIEEPLPWLMSAGGFCRLEDGPAYGDQVRVLHYVFIDRSDLDRAALDFSLSPCVVEMINLEGLSPYLQLAVKIALANDYTSPDKTETESIRIALVKAEWSTVFPDIPYSPNTASALAKVMAFPNKKAIEQGKKARGSRNG